MDEMMQIQSDKFASYRLQIRYKQSAASGATKLKPNLENVLSWLVSLYSRRLESGQNPSALASDLFKIWGIHHR